MVPITRTVNTNAQSFVFGLALDIDRATSRRFPADRGYFALDPIPSPWPTTPFLEITGHRTFYGDDGQSDTLETDWLFRFDIVQRNDKEIKVTAECREPALQSFFDELIAVNMPEMMQSAALPMREQPTPSVATDAPQADGEPQAKTAALPKRGANLRRWKATWAVVEPFVMKQRLPDGEVLKALNNKLAEGDERRCSLETLVKIIEAGQQGLLDDS